MARVYEKAKKLLEEIGEISSGNTTLRVMAVTKNQSVDAIDEARQAGFNLFGENRIQEFLTKEDYFLAHNLEVHLIGHLQSNKVKQAVGRFSVIQSIDSIMIAETVNNRASALGIVQDILLEVNIGREANKYGFFYEDMIDAVKTVSRMENLRICGLMTIPPVAPDSELRLFFSMMKSLFIDIIDKNIDNVFMNILSMGMSADYGLAILEGSNMVRLGSAVFG